MLLAIPLWFLVKAGVQALFIRLPAPQGREIQRADAPALDGRRGKQAEMIDRLAKLEWPVPLVFVSLDGRFGRWLGKLRAPPGAPLV